MAYTDTTLAIIVIVVVAHLIGIILFFLNSVHLVCTRKKKTQVEPPERSCKINAGLAWTILMLNHVVLQVMGFLFVIIVKIEEQIDEKITDKQDLIKALIFIPGFNFAFVLFYLGPFTVSEELRRKERIGYLTTNNLFAFCNCFVFWSLCGVSLACAFMDINEIPEFEFLVKGIGVIPIAAAYAGMVLEAAISEQCTIVSRKNSMFQKTVSKVDAVKIIEEILKKEPSVHWSVFCGDNLCTKTGELFW